jgi:3-oxoacyl-[acyl-carrier protein] reductase
MDLGLQDRVALVTGGSKGIGRAIAAGLVGEGAKVAIASRSEERIAEAAEATGARGYVFDSDDLDAVDGLVGRVEADLGPVDVYVANTGGPPTGPDPLGFSREEWEAAHRSLVLSPMAFLERLLPGMQERGWGRVIAIGSAAVREPLDAIQLSNAHRPGMVAAFKVLSRRFAKDGVTFNFVHPGRIATERVFGAFPREEVEADAARTIPAGRLGTPEELAAAVLFLAGEPAAYITGQAITVDGGSMRSV